MRRIYLSPVVRVSAGADLELYVPAIESALMAQPRGQRGKAEYIDLRVAEDQMSTRGWMLVVIDGNEANEASILAAGGVLVPRSKAGISTVIGAEGNGETLSGTTDDDAIDYLRRIHTVRVARFRPPRNRVR